LEVKLKKLDLIDLLPVYNDGIKQVTLFDSWLSGYMDSRILFYGRWHKSKKIKWGKKLYLCCIFWHLSEDLLQQIKKVIRSSENVEYKLKSNLPLYKLVILDLDEKTTIKDYIDKYPLKTIKKNIYPYWKKLLDLEKNSVEINEQDLLIIEKTLIKLAKLIKKNGEINKV